VTQKQTGSITSLATETLLKQASVPEGVKHTFRRTVGCMKSSEQMLWREVAARMTLDALGITPEVITIFEGMEKANYKRFEKTVLDARAWFERKQRDSELVFELAGVDSRPIRRVIELLPVLVPPRDLRMAKPRDRSGHHAQQAA
jgi:hypothetical protein